MDRTFGTHKRFFQIETLASAVEGQIALKDPGIIASFREAFGPMTVSSMTFDLIGETRYHLVFQVKAASFKQRPRTLGMVVAKNHEEGSKATSAEYKALQQLAPRLGKMILKTYQSGRVYLPDRYRRTDVKRTLFLYMTEWTSGFSTFSANKTGQIRLTGKTTHVYTRKETENFKVNLIGLFAAAYDPIRRTGMDVRASSFESFVVRHTTSGNMVPKLVAPPPLTSKLSPTQLIDRILTLEWRTESAPFPVAPLAPEDVYLGLTSTVDNERVHDWLNAYLRTRKEKATGVFREYLEELDVYINSRPD
jgi:hypothetical protein